MQTLGERREQQFFVDLVDASQETMHGQVGVSQRAARGCERNLGAQRGVGITTSSISIQTSCTFVSIVRIWLSGYHPPQSQRTRTSYSRGSSPVTPDPARSKLEGRFNTSTREEKKEGGVHWGNARGTNVCESRKKNGGLSLGCSKQKWRELGGKRTSVSILSLVRGWIWEQSEKQPGQYGDCSRLNGNPTWSLTMAFLYEEQYCRDCSKYSGRGSHLEKAGEGTVCQLIGRGEIGDNVVYPKM